LTGTITTEADGAAPATADSTAKAPSTPTVRVMPANGDNFGSVNARANPDGTFEVHDIQPDRYRVTVGGMGSGVYVKSIRFGNEDITYGVVDLINVPGGQLDIKLSRHAAQVQGTVHNDKGETVADAQVTLAPIAAELAATDLLFRSARTNSTGQFTLRNLPPGEYRVLAWEEVSAEILNDPEFRAHFDSSATTVKLSEDSHESVDLKQVGKDAIELEAAKVR